MIRQPAFFAMSLAMTVARSSQAWAQDTPPSGDVPAQKFCETVVLDCNARTLVCADADKMTPAQKAALKTAKLLVSTTPKPLTIASSGKDDASFAATTLCTTPLTFPAMIQLDDGKNQTSLQLANITTPQQKADTAKPPPDCTPNPSTIREGNDDPSVLIVSYDKADRTPVIVLPRRTKDDRSSGLGTIKTNTRLRVIVLRPPQYPAQVVVDGAAAQLSGTSIVGSTGTPTGGARETEACREDEWSLAPRASGAIKITTQLTDSSGNVYKSSAHVSEILVETQYVGAIRVGIGVVFPLDQNPTGFGTSVYSVRASPQGGNQIYRDSWTLADLELIGGYTAFLGDRGLSELGKPSFGLFGGLGLIAVSPNSGNVTGLTSGYVGLEFSYQGLQLLPLFGVRRETALLGSYQVGNHVAAGATVTGTAFFPVVAIMVGFTSDVLKIPGGNFP
jgi:hypothetical protein